MEVKSTPMASVDANAEVKKIKLFKFAEVNVPKNIPLAEFVEKFVTEWSAKHATVYADGSGEQCHAGARRSLGDITRACHYYISEKVTIEQVKDILKKLVRDNIISADICSQIHKRVYFRRVNKAQTYTEMEDRDEFGYKFKPDSPTKRVLSEKERQAIKARKNAKGKTSTIRKNKS